MACGYNSQKFSCDFLVLGSTSSGKTYLVQQLKSLPKIEHHETIPSIGVNIDEFRLIPYQKVMSQSSTIINCNLPAEGRKLEKSKSKGFSIFSSTQRDSTTHTNELDFHSFITKGEDLKFEQTAMPQKLKKEKDIHISTGHNSDSHGNSIQSISNPVSSSVLTNQVQTASSIDTSSHTTYNFASTNRQRFIFKEVGGTLTSTWYRYAQDCHVIILTIDASQHFQLSQSVIEFLKLIQFKKPIVCVLTKTDMPSTFAGDFWKRMSRFTELKTQGIPIEFIEVSSYNGSNLSELSHLLREVYVKVYK